MRGIVRHCSCRRACRNPAYNRSRSNSSDYGGSDSSYDAGRHNSAHASYAADNAASHHSGAAPENHMVYAAVTAVTAVFVVIVVSFTSAFFAPRLFRVAFRLFANALGLFFRLFNFILTLFFCVCRGNLRIPLRFFCNRLFLLLQCIFKLGIGGKLFRLLRRLLRLGLCYQHSDESDKSSAARTACDNRPNAVGERQKRHAEKCQKRQYRTHGTNLLIFIPHPILPHILPRFIPPENGKIENMTATSEEHIPIQS